ncbi:AraC family transcriptional regulator [Mucilaginibacter sabulilitoris]|uniref:AraC family transcriptional regulator n=1 Tax=Mucilaginibacter sabulilitoris TaxID=1173583 RepID=A0ABZ0TYT1_9SPHI|nr:AraC family transcriptional regulator [Mucilaginibacter sabulilitoris]WPU96250.1 AraC family transcriptional regulator [Mucilaginibacter sabulilitoris]
MKPHFYKVAHDLQCSFSANLRVQPNFGKLWHYHPELELHYVIKGKGVRFIGDNVSNFDENEMILLGENLPHTWRCKEEFYQSDPEIKTEAIVIQFLPEFIGKEFLSIPEALPFRQLFENARKGLYIKGQTKEHVLHLMKEAVSSSGMDRIIALLAIINELSQSNELVSIASSNTFYQSNAAESFRLNKIYTYTLANYKNALPLEEIANVANLSATSFCRYFKRVTNKSYHDFLMEIRISNACRLLIEDKLSIHAICFECGFGNLANFYRYFGRIKQTTPDKYRRTYLDRKNI